MKQVDSKEAVESFLLKAHNILEDKDFNIKNNFYVKIYRQNYSTNNNYTNESTMLELGYNAQNIVDEILSLTAENYKETFIDNAPGKTKPFYCFIKSINGKQVYIKFKISEEKNKQVFCISFHFAEREVKDEELPYKSSTWTNSIIWNKEKKKMCEKRKEGNENEIVWN